MKLHIFILCFLSIISLSLPLEDNKHLRHISPMFLTRRQPLLLQRHKRQTTGEDCDFPVTDGVVDSCSLIMHPGGLSLEPWKVGIGTGANWVGGPNKDANDNLNGGYAFVSMSDMQLGTSDNVTSWMLTTPRQSTGALGQCLRFKYQIDGMSSSELSVGLFNFNGSVTVEDIKGPPTNGTPLKEHSDGPTLANSSSSASDNIGRELDYTGTNYDNLGGLLSDREESEDNVSREGLMFLHADNPSPPLTSSNEKEAPSGIKYTVSKLWIERDSTEKVWREATISYTCAKLHSIGFRAKADTRYRSYRGHIAVDNIEFSEGPCDNDCQFDSDFCSWSNVGNNEDEFDWSLARSSNKRGTGPSRDHESTFIPGLETGGYAYIDSGFPRRPYDRARLTSAEITAGEIPFCFKFWVHMYGGGIGTLRVFKKVGNSPPVELWMKEGSDLLDRWYLSQLTLSAKKGTTFRVIVEGEVGYPASGDIAIDTLTIKEGACPRLPPGSGIGTSIADCTFLVNSCEWSLQQPTTLTSSFTPMLFQAAGSSFTPGGHTPIYFEGKDYFMKFDLGNYKHRVRDSAFIVSPAIKNSGEGLCMSFWVYMFTNVPTETSVGALSVIISTSEKNTTVWRLENKQHSGWVHCQVSTKEISPIQIYIRGTKGTKKTGMIGVDDITVYNSECQLSPPEAAVTEMDCSFDGDECRWKIESANSVTSVDPNEAWRYAGEKFIIHVVTDHTYKIDKAGFMFIEAFNDDIASVFVSPMVDSGTDVACFTFYYASFFADNTAQLTVSRRSKEGTVTTLWRVTQANLPPRPVGNIEVEWNYGQIQIEKGSFMILIDGKVRTGGWAIDDLKLLKGWCPTRPVAAAVLPPNGPPPSSGGSGTANEISDSGGNKISSSSGTRPDISSNSSLSGGTSSSLGTSGVGISGTGGSSNTSLTTDSKETSVDNETSSVNETAISGDEAVVEDTSSKNDTSTPEETSSPSSSDVGKDETKPEGETEEKGSGEGAEETATAASTEEIGSGNGAPTDSASPAESAR